MRSLCAMFEQNSGAFNAKIKPDTPRQQTRGILARSRTPESPSSRFSSRCTTLLELSIEDALETPGVRTRPTLSPVTTSSHKAKRLDLSGWLQPIDVDDDIAATKTVFLSEHTHEAVSQRSAIMSASTRTRRTSARLQPQSDGATFSAGGRVQTRSTRSTSSTG